VKIAMIGGERKEVQLEKNESSAALSYLSYSRFRPLDTRSLSAVPAYFSEKYRTPRLN
jgi:hypothetical protein